MKDFPNFLKIWPTGFAGSTGPPTWESRTYRGEIRGYTISDAVKDAHAYGVDIDTCVSQMIECLHTLTGCRSTKDQHEEMREYLTALLCDFEELPLLLDDGFSFNPSQDIIRMRLEIGV